MKIEAGKKYLVRADRAGVFYGEIKELSHDEVTMTNVRKIHYWDGASAVEELAKSGTFNPNNCRITVTVDEMAIADPIQVIPMTDEAVKSLDGVKEWTQRR